MSISCQAGQRRRGPLVRGLGLGVALIPVMTVAFVDIDERDLPDASMLTRISQQVGGSFGVAIGAVVLESAVAGGRTLTHAFGQASWWVTVLAVLVSFFLPGRRVQGAGEPVAPARGQAADAVPASR